MLKILLCLVACLLLSVLILHLRQQKLELAHDANQLHNQIEALQAKLWNQQMQIAIPIAPNAIANTVNTHDLKMVPRSPLPASTANWIDGRTNPDAE
jgi:cell division protein FtsL